ncbi:cell division protein ZapD [Uliginosibacterium sp. 31-16]|uniref:cell division protein ZapD n=1 Tax=Uliginosibacterium sp. 31-16 TaxID=3068315 RepID=UPI00273D47D2|nr:cell division protein ZapD [Uliginosibacterium sp. 31-16]MDP5241131.1 cell division protein ZapD [Uliginosibacterium sp. 31-16]
MITYEYPLSERIRTLLRLEDLFDKVLHFSLADGAYEHHTALLALFEILDVAGRADLKVDLVQELERQRQILLAFRDNPQISEEALSGALYEIEHASSALLAMAGRIGQYLRESEWLMAIRSRTAIPGGVCEFDLPSYHFWLNRDADKRRRDIQGWLAPMLPIRDGLTIILRLLRESGRAEDQMAKRGSYQIMMSGRHAQLVRVRLDRDAYVLPEISANKYAFNIRFVAPDVASRPRQAETDIPFELTFCSL